MALRIIGVIAALGLATVGLAQDRLLWGSLKPGKFGVGFRTEIRYNLSRRYDRDYVRDPENLPERSPRPILVAIWYPTAKSGRPMPYREYLELPEAFGKQLSPWTGDVLAQDVFGKALKELSKDESAAYRRLLDVKTYASKDAPPAAGKFPLVINHAGLGGGYEDNSSLFEYLASHGYIVVSSAFQAADGETLNLDWDLERSLQDLDFLAQVAGELPNVNSGRMAVMGHSYGGQAVLAWAATPFCSASALITLDSGLETVPLNFPGIMPLYNSMEAHRANIRFPVLRLTKQSEEQRFDYLDPYLKYAPSYECTVGSVRHNDFLTHGAISPLLRPGGRPDGAHVRESYDRICTHVLAFLGVALKQNREAKDRLFQDLDKSFTLKQRNALPPPPNARQLVEIVRRDGMDRAVDLLRQCKDDVEVGSDGIGGAAQTFFDEGKLTEAIDLLRRSSELLPESMPIFARLGGLLAQTGEKPKAIAAYLRARECVAFQKADADTKARWTKEIEGKLKALGWNGTSPQK